MPRAKRAKQYRKMMQKFGINFGFREPYQVIVDAELLRYANSCKMDLVKGLEQTLSGRVKPMITTCSMRHLKSMDPKEPGVSAAIHQGYSEQFERRRCGHHPDEYPEPLSALECLSAVVDPKDTGANKHRYIVASNEQEVRAALRLVRGVPLIYINRSVMIMEPMAEGTSQERSREERKKLRAELKQPVGKKRKRDNDEGEDSEDEDFHAEPRAAPTEGKAKKVQSSRGPKGPNPLSVRKKKTTTPASGAERKAPSSTEQDASQSDAIKKKRKRKKKPATGAEATDVVEQPAAEAES